MFNWVPKRYAVQKLPLGSFPRRHLALAASTLIATGIALMLLPGENAEAKRTSIPLSLDLTPQKPATIAEPLAEPIEKIEETPWIEFSVKPGDSLSSLFGKAGLSAQDLHELISKANKAKALNKIRPGQ